MKGWGGDTTVCSLARSEMPTHLTDAWAFSWKNLATGGRSRGGRKPGLSWEKRQLTGRASELSKKNRNGNGSSGLQGGKKKEEREDYCGSKTWIRCGGVKGSMGDQYRDSTEFA